MQLLAIILAALLLAGGIFVGVNYATGGCLTNDNPKPQPTPRPNPNPPGPAPTIPEPSTAILLPLGASVLLMRRRFFN